MKTFNEMKQIATDYAKQKYGNSAIIYGPLFRMENNELCLGYIFIEFNDELKNDYRVKRPTMWLLQNLNNGEIIDCFETSVKDFSSNEKLPYDSLYSNDGVSILYDDVNYISKSFHKWHTNIKRELSEVNANNVNPIYDEEVLKISNEIISPKDYVLANTEIIFNEMYELLFSKLGNTITEAFDNYQESLFESIRREKNLNTIKNYYNFIKYSYPELVDVINAFNNIDGTIDNKYDENLKTIIEDKNKTKKDKFNNMLNDIDNKLKDIDDSYVPPVIDENNIPKINSNVDIKDLISSIDKKLEELDKEN